MPKSYSYNSNVMGHFEHKQFYFISFSFSDFTFFFFFSYFILKDDEEAHDKKVT